MTKIYVNGKPLEQKKGQSLFEALVDDSNWIKTEVKNPMWIKEKPQDMQKRMAREVAEFHHLLNK